MKRVFLLLAVLLILTSCGVQWQYSTLTTAAQIDNLRTVPNFEQSVDTLTLSEFKWKLRTDSRFAWDYQTYVLNQDFHWYSDYYWTNRLWRRGFYSSWDFYWNRYDVWNHWSWNSHMWLGHNWYRPWNYGVNSFWYSYSSWYQGPFNNPSYNVIWNNSRYSNVSFVNGRRNNLVSNSIQNRLLVNRTVRNTIKPANYNKPLIISNNNDKIIRPNNGANWKPQSGNNGRGRGSWEIVPPQPTKPVYSNPVQSGQIRGGSGSPVLQQTRTSINSGGQGRSSSGRGIN